MRDPWYGRPGLTQKDQNMSELPAQGGNDSAKASRPGMWSYAVMGAIIIAFVVFLFVS